MGVLNLLNSGSALAANASAAVGNVINIVLALLPH